jgi:two-component system phosphate regulon sensor histidine kinase PhoR
MVDSQRQVLTVNQTARDLFAPSGDPLEQTLIALTRHHEIDALAEDALSGSEDLDRQITIDNRPFRIRAQTAVESPHAPHDWVAIALRDVSELQRLSRARREMVANISHELRTPITSIRLLVDTLVDGALTHTTQGPQLLDKIAAETSTLQQMAEELLDLSMIESGQAIVKLVPRPVSELLNEATNRLSEQARRKKQTLAHEGCANLTVLADSEMAIRVLTNLLHNAIKFAPEGGHIGVACERDAEWVRISVTDDGPGIAFADRDRVFERFYRGDRARGGAGTGLGLAIAKHIVEAHGGRIWVAEREIGEPGTQLIFTLPRANSEAAPPTNGT